MTTKKRLRERLLDICAGAGLNWQEDCEYWDNLCMKTMGAAVHGIERAFNLPDDNRLRLPFRWEELETLDGMVDLVFESIEFDRGGEEK